MNLLSITFHSTENVTKQWANYVQNTLIPSIENFTKVERYILSDVDSRMLNEGKNTNLLLIFENQDEIHWFMDSEIPHLQGLIEQQFGNEVMIFCTFLNPIHSKF